MFRLFILNLLFVSLISCSFLPDNTQRHNSYAIETSQQNIYENLFNQARPINTEYSQFSLIATGLDAFAIRALLINSANQTIDAQYYLLHDDLVGKLFLSLLVNAADRGVRVRLLLDDIGLHNKTALLVGVASHPNIEVRTFNPFSRYVSPAIQYISRFGYVTRRMHNKSFIVDNQAVVIGGRNLGNEYFDADNSSLFGDLDALVFGPVVQQVSTSFDEYWNNEKAYPISNLQEIRLNSKKPIQTQLEIKAFQKQYSNSDYAKAILNSKLAKDLSTNSFELHQGKAEVIVDSPEKISKHRKRKDLHLSSKVLQEFAAAKKEVIIISPYFIPGRAGTNSLVALARKGVNIKIFTNSLISNNHIIVHAHYAKYRKTLLNAGIEIYELRHNAILPENIGTNLSATLHAKAFVIDQKRVFVGSLNFDQRSFTENTEIGIIFESPSMAKDITNWFDTDLKEVAYQLYIDPEINSNRVLWKANVNGKELIYKKEPYRTLWKGLKIRFISLLPIESQL